MNKIKSIRTDADYKEALIFLEELMYAAPDPDTDEGQQLKILATLIQAYEANNFPSTLPDPIDAIKFRMDQASLKPVDLIPFLGSRSRVSEVLSRKRPLSLEMIRALEVGLGIPAKVLIQQPKENINSEYQNWDNRLFHEMESYGYFDEQSVRTNKETMLEDFFSSFSSQPQFATMWRKSSYRAQPLTNKNALHAWSTRVINRANKIILGNTFEPGSINIDSMQQFAKLSTQQNCPIVAQNWLKELGIKLIIEPHLSQTHLDGAAIFINKNNPIIGLTLRYDRLDNFWFTLMHELAHISLHFNQETDLFFDELEKLRGVDISSQEKEADDLAGEALVPTSLWEISPAKLVPSSLAASSLAKKLGVDISIVAGKMRYEGGKWAYLNKIISEAKVRIFFPEIKWITK